MPLETATFVNELVETNPVNTDSVRQGDDHIRLIKSTLKATFPNITGALTGTTADFNNGQIPIGGIILWSGSIASIPTGWALCNGASGTPNLQDRFVVGAGGAYAVGATGGADTVALTTAQLPAHTHGDGTLATSSAGSHTHSFSATTSTASLTGTFDVIATDSTGGDPILRGGTGIVSVTADGGSNSGHSAQRQSVSRTMDRATINASHNHSVSGTTGSNGSHTHSITGSTASTGSGDAHENRPPYYALAYIMRIA